VAAVFQPATVLYLIVSLDFNHRNLPNQIAAAARNAAIGQIRNGRPRDPETVRSQTGGMIYCPV
jgi:hypothetical protein